MTHTCWEWSWCKRVVRGFVLCARFECRTRYSSTQLTGGHQEGQPFLWLSKNWLSHSGVAYVCTYNLWRMWDMMSFSVPVPLRRGSKRKFSPNPHRSGSRHVDASMETVEVANKELKVETRLYNIESRWKDEPLEFVRHRDTEVCTYTILAFGAVDDYVRRLGIASHRRESTIDVSSFSETYGTSKDADGHRFTHCERLCMLSPLRQEQMGYMHIPPPVINPHEACMAKVVVAHPNMWRLLA